MRIQIQREDLLRPLALVSGAAERRQTLPILSNILIRQQTEALVLTGTDLEIEIVVQAVPAGGDDGELTLPARKLLEICRALPDTAKIEIKYEKDKAILKSGRSRFSLLTLPASEYPSLETSKWTHTLHVKQGALRTVLDKTQFCMAQQDVRYYLNGMLFDFTGNELHTVATDGHRMALNVMRIDSALPEPQMLIVPRKAIQEIVRFLGDDDSEATLRFNANHIRLELNTLVFTSKLIDGRYPDYHKVIPDSQRTELRINRESFRSTLARVAILSNEKYRGVRLSLGAGSMRLAAHNPEHEEAQEELPVDYNGDELEVGFNANYIIDAVSALESDEIELGITDANSSCTLRTPGDDSQLYVVMPMRL